MLSLSGRWFRNAILAGLAILFFAASAYAAAPTTGRRRPPAVERAEARALPRFQAVPGRPVFFPRELLRRTVELEEEVEEPGDATIDSRSRFVPPGFDSKRRRGTSNHLINDPSGDPPFSTQSENTIVASGRYLVAGWNDQFDTRVPRSFTGFGYSSDAGETWTDGGILPPAGSADAFFGDPSLAVDSEGNFYFASLYAPDSARFGLSVSRGKFRGDKLRFGPPVLVEASATDLLDKEWIAADPDNGDLYVTYTRFAADESWSQIELKRSRDGGHTWSGPWVLTDRTTSLPQGSRPLVGPDHELYVVYNALDLSNFSTHMRIRKSTNRGRSFGPEADIGESRRDSTLYLNTVTGPPGFNRPGGVALPSIAVDRSHGDSRGTVYVAWPEGVDFFDDPLGGDGVTFESESNDVPANATSFDPGVTLVGALSANTDADWYSFEGKAGQTVELFLLGDPSGPADGFLRLFAGDGTTADRVAFSYFGDGLAFVVYTLPSDGRYLLRVLVSRPGADLGGYFVFTGFHVPRRAEVGRDANDVVISSSTDGRRWTRRQRVNDDRPLFHQSLPEVAVDSRGDVHLVWYDPRNDRADGILSDVYRSRSDGGGRDFDDNVQVNDGPPTNWNLVSGTLAPNMGDYISLFADGGSVYANWAEGRLGSPDSWMTKLGEAGRHHRLALDSDGVEDQAAAGRGSDGARLALRAPNPAPLGAPITVEFALPRPGVASLEVYSIAGQRVRTLFEGAVDAGVRQATWDGRDRAGDRVAPGMYFVLLRGQDLRLERRVVLVP